VSGASSAHLLGLLGLLGLTGCSAPAACSEERWLATPNLESKAVTGSLTLAPSDGAARRSFELVLSNLPELWQGSDNVFDGGVTFAISTEYPSDPIGNDGKTQMPRVAATLAVDDTELSQSVTSAEFPNGSVEGPELPLFFNGCDSEGHGPGCCAYGMPECALSLSMSLKRLDAAPFPAVTVSWSAQAHANVTSCPLSDHAQVEIALTEGSL